MPPIHRYPALLGDELSDQVGSNDLTWGGSTPNNYTNPPPGKGDGQAFVIDADEYFDLDTALALGTFSLSLWTNHTWVGGAGNRNFVSDAGSVTEYIQLNDTGDVLQIRTNGTSAVQVGPTDFADSFDGEWHLFNFTYDGTVRVTAILDAVSIASATFVDPVYEMDRWLADNSGGVNFLGSNFDLRIYDRELTLGESAVLYSGPEIPDDKSRTLANTFLFHPWF